MATRITLNVTYPLRRTCSKCANDWSELIELCESYEEGGYFSALETGNQRKQAEARLQKTIDRFEKTRNVLCPACGGLALSLWKNEFANGVVPIAIQHLSSPLRVGRIIGGTALTIGTLSAFTFPHPFLLLTLAAGCTASAFLYAQTYERLRLVALHATRQMTESEAEQRIQKACQICGGDLRENESFWVAAFSPNRNRPFEWLSAVGL